MEFGVKTHFYNRTSVNLPQAVIYKWEVSGIYSCFVVCEKFLFQFIKSLTPVVRTVFLYGAGFVHSGAGGDQHKPLLKIIVFLKHDPDFI